MGWMTRRQAQWTTQGGRVSRHQSLCTLTDLFSEPGRLSGNGERQSPARKSRSSRWNSVRFHLVTPIEREKFLLEVVSRNVRLCPASSGNGSHHDKEAPS